jgi:hypothetical protein
MARKGWVPWRVLHCSGGHLGSSMKKRGRSATNPTWTMRVGFEIWVEPRMAVGADEDEDEDEMTTTCCLAPS